jgi:hypothetical protein
MRDFRDAKVMAHALRDALKSRAVETTHSESLELIAKAFGFENWNILAAKIEAARPRGEAAPAPSPPSAPDAAGPDKTLYCSFCGKSQHVVRKLVAGPSVYICDECSDLCTEIVRGDDPFWKILSLLATGSDGYAAALDLVRGQSTEEVTAYVERTKQWVEKNREIVRYYHLRLQPRPDEQSERDDILRSPRFAHLTRKSTTQLGEQQQDAQLVLKRCEEALRIGTTVLGERGQQGSA